MFAVIFEVQPRPERFDEYLQIAARLKPELERIDGFIDNERYRSRRDQGRILSLSIWRDEKAVIRWRTLGVHHAAQAKGRGEIFRDYHLRVGEITADTGLRADEALPQHRLDATEVGEAKTVTVTELTLSGPSEARGRDLAAELGLPEHAGSGAADREVFESIYTAGKLLLLAGWTDAGAASRWRPHGVAGRAVRHRVVRIVRDYGMADRREAPQYYPPVPAAAVQA
jgi:heme-degrading monooxygenase HmoA